jgi:5-carboxymethyl-2-hydroxymuconate isomerase
MPHFRIEYSANLEDQVDMPKFCKSMLKAILDTGLFEIGAVRVRAFRAEHFAIADEVAANSFVDLVFHVAEGRGQEALKKAGDHIFDVAKSNLATLFETPHFALSFRIEEITPALSWKQNAMHARLRGA